MSDSAEFETFIEGVKYMQDKGNIIPEGMEKNRQYLKDDVLKRIKTLFQALDSNDKNSAVQISLKLALNAYSIASATGKIDDVVDSFLKENKTKSLKK